MALYVDTETTGLSASDEIVEIAIINDDGEALLNTLVRPVYHSLWPEAQAIHGISPKEVAHAPTYDELRPTIRGLFQDQEVVIYNKAYDSQYLGSELGAAKSVQCCMLLFDEHYGEWNHRYGNYKWQNLVVGLICYIAWILTPNSILLISKPMTISCILSSFEKQIVFLANRLIQVRKFRFLRSIF